MSTKYIFHTIVQQSFPILPPKPVRWRNSMQQLQCHVHLFHFDCTNHIIHCHWHALDNKLNQFCKIQSYRMFQVGLVTNFEILVFQSICYEILKICHNALPCNVFNKSMQHCCENALNRFPFLYSPHSSKGYTNSTWQSYRLYKSAANRSA